MLSRPAFYFACPCRLTDVNFLPATTGETELGQSLTGKCWCRDSEFTHTGGVKFTIRCYCRDCQHISGGGHLPQVAVSRDRLTRSANIQTYRRKSAHGNDLAFSFCKSCGSPLFKSTSMAQETIFPCAGPLEDFLTSASRMMSSRIVDSHGTRAKAPPNGAAPKPSLTEHRSYARE